MDSDLEECILEQIKEIIVVEGRDDECAIKRAVNATVIKTSGFALSKKHWLK